MLFANLLTYAQKRIAAHRRYRQAIAEIDAMSQNDLIEIGAFQTDLYEAARREYLA